MVGTSNFLKDEGEDEDAACQPCSLVTITTGAPAPSTNSSQLGNEMFTYSLGAFLTATSVLCPGVNESFKRSFPVHYSSLGLMIMSPTGFQSLMIWGLVSQAQVLSWGTRCGVQTSHS